MNLGGLINLADTTPEFRQLITDRYMIATFRIHEQEIVFQKQDIPMYIPADTIAIGNVHTIVRFLRIFGHLVTKMELKGSEFEANEVLLITQYIGEYCAKNVLELEMIGAGEYLISNTEHVFEKAEIVHFHDVKPLENVQIHRIFPNINELKLESKFTRLYHNQNTQNIMNSLSSLPQLRKLSLHGLATFDLLPVISANLLHLESLSIAYYIRNFIVPTNQTFHFDTIKSLEISVLGTDILNNSHPVDTLPLTFANLESLKIKSSLLRNMPINLIEENVGLRELSLPQPTEMALLWPVFSRIRSTHTNLKALTVVWHELDNDQTVELMTRFQQLQKITFRVCDVGDTRFHLSALLNLVPNEWQVDQIYEFTATVNHKYDVTVTRKQL